MGKILLGTLLLALTLAVPIPIQAELSVGVSISLPPPVVFEAPPELIVLPGTYVYVAPDIDDDIYFYSGWWWRPWRGHWYRSRHYDSGWGYYRNVPSFYGGIHPGWRHDYREHRWQGRPWDYHRIPHHQVHQNWRSWERGRHWEKQRNWGVDGLHSPSRSRHPSREIDSRQHRSGEREARPERSQKSRGAQEMQSRQSRPPEREARSERSPQHGNRERGSGRREERRPELQQTSQEVQPRQSRNQATEVKSGRSRKHGGNPENGEEEQKGRR